MIEVISILLHFTYHFDFEAEVLLKVQRKMYFSILWDRLTLIYFIEWNFRLLEFHFAN